MKHEKNFSIINPNLTPTQVTLRHLSTGEEMVDVFKWWMYRKSVCTIKDGRLWKSKILSDPYGGGR